MQKVLKSWERLKSLSLTLSSLDDGNSDYEADDEIVVWLPASCTQNFGYRGPVEQ